MGHIDKNSISTKVFNYINNRLLILFSVDRRICKLINARTFRKDGIWFRDDKGRFVIFRGINLASRSKLYPYIPTMPLQTNSVTLEDLKKEIDSLSPQFNLLKDLGFNIVRLLIMWKGIEPYPNKNLDNLLQEGKQYLTLVTQIIDKLYSLGMLVIIDFHQDIAHEIYGGDGFPDWALAIDEFHSRPLLPPTLKDRHWITQYYINYLVRHTLRSFWKNNLKNIEQDLVNFSVRTHLEKTIGQTVRFFKELNGGQGHPAILGFSPFNEPHHIDFDKKIFEEKYLKEFYYNVLAEIRKFDNEIFIFIEPRVDWTVYPAQNNSNGILDEFTFIREANQIRTWLPIDNAFIDQFKSTGVLSFHYYDPWTMSYGFLNLADNMYNKEKEWPSIFSKLRDSAAARNLIPFLTEFGASHDWEYLQTNFEPMDTYKKKQIRVYMDLLFTQIEHFLLNSTYWNWDFYNTAENKDNWNLENFSLLGPDRIPRHTDIAARPYPLYSSAEPELLFFNLRSKYCAIILKGSVVDAPTVIYIPYNIHYKSFFKVWTTSNQVEWDTKEQLLYWFPNKKMILNQIIITPSQNLDEFILPAESRDLLQEISFSKEFRN
jgi:hypothetical protein